MSHSTLISVHIYGYIGRFFDVDNIYVDFYVTDALKINIPGLDIYEVKSISTHNDMTLWHKKLKFFIEKGGFFFSTKTNLASPFSLGVSDRFCWNSIALEQFEDSIGHVVNYPELSLMYGHVSAIKFPRNCLSSPDEQYVVTIHRRCTLRVGPRYTSRGLCRSSGLASNLVQTEQFIYTPFKSIRCMTVSFRGSPAIIWSQMMTLMSVNDRVHSDDEQAFAHHVKRDFSGYDELIIFSLLSEGISFQRELNDAQANVIAKFNATNEKAKAEDHKAPVVRLIRTDVLNKKLPPFNSYNPKYYFPELLEVVDKEIILSTDSKNQLFADGCNFEDTHSFETFLHLRQPVFGQTRTFRVNCVDSTDRTHVGLACINWRILTKALSSLSEENSYLNNTVKNSTSNITNVPNKEFIDELAEAFFKSWGVSGAALAHQYCGSNLIRAERFVKGSGPQELKDFLRCLIRWGKNRFYDGETYVAMHIMVQRLNEARKELLSHQSYRENELADNKGSKEDKVTILPSPFSLWLERRGGSFRIMSFFMIWISLWLLLAGFIDAFLLSLRFVGIFGVVTGFAWYVKKMKTVRVFKKLRVMAAVAASLGIAPVSSVIGFLVVGIVATLILKIGGMVECLVDQRGNHRDT